MTFLSDSHTAGKFLGLRYGSSVPRRPSLAKGGDEFESLFDVHGLSWVG